jgi:transposase-like protein
MRNVLAHAGKSGRRVVSAFIATAFAQEDAATARAQWRQVVDQLRPKVPKLAAMMDEVEADVLAFMSSPKDHRPKIHSTNPLERLNGEIKRRTDVVGIFPNDAAIIRLVGAILLEQNDDWAVDRGVAGRHVLAVSASAGSSRNRWTVELEADRSAVASTRDELFHTAHPLICLVGSRRIIALHQSSRRGHRRTHSAPVKLVKDS